MSFLTLLFAGLWPLCRPWALLLLCSRQPVLPTSMWNWQLLAVCWYSLYQYCYSSRFHDSSLCSSLNFWHSLIFLAHSITSTKECSCYAQEWGHDETTLPSRASLSVLTSAAGWYLIWVGHYLQSLAYGHLCRPSDFGIHTKMVLWFQLFCKLIVWT